MTTKLNDTAVKFSSYDALKAGYGAMPIRTFKVTIDTSDLTDAATSQAVSLGTDDAGNSFPANARVIGATCHVLTAFAGGSVSALTMQVGDAADPNELLVATDMTATGFTDAPGVYTPWTLEATAYAGLATFTSTDDNLDALTAGKVEVYIHYFKPEALRG